MVNGDDSGAYQAREGSLALLIAEGKSNKEIGESAYQH